MSTPDDVLRAGFVRHVVVVVDGAPLAVPTVYGVDVDARVLHVHGSVTGRGLVRSPGAPVCAPPSPTSTGSSSPRSVPEHGVDHRCAMVHGTPRRSTRPR